MSMPSDILTALEKSRITTLRDRDNPTRCEFCRFYSGDHEHRLLRTVVAVLPQSHCFVLRGMR